MSLQITLTVFGLVALVCASAATAKPPKQVPVIYSTDLCHPHDDPDDHFDIACMYAMPEVDLRAIILDNGEHQAQRPGWKPVWQLNALTGRHVPAAMGLLTPLRSCEDKALDQPAEYQNGVNLMLQALRDSEEKVTIIFVGSARDTAAAFNREPGLFKSKVKAIYGHIGEANGPCSEYNIGLDRRAFERMMRSDLPFYWIPCFDGGQWKNDSGLGSYWVTLHGDLLNNSPEPMLRFFLYMTRKPADDPIAYLYQTTTPDTRTWFMKGKRNLWAGGLLGLYVGRKIQVDGKDIAGFEPVDVVVNEREPVKYGQSPGSHRVMRFRIYDQTKFAEAATKATAEILAAFPVMAQDAK